MTFYAGLKQLLLDKPLIRWGGSFVMVTGVYASAILLVVNWHSDEHINAMEPMAALMIDLAPMLVAPDTPPSEVPPGPEQQETPPPPEHKPEPEPEIDPLPELPTIKEAEAELPPEKEVTKKLEPTPIEQQIAQDVQAPPAFDAPKDDIAAAPKEGVVSLTPSQAPAKWQSVLLMHLEHHKRYPREARRKRQEAVVYVRVSINRDGTVVDYRLEKPSAYNTLNQATMALIARAQPLPSPPKEVTGDIIEFVVPVEFFLKR
ncbi:energy transducer TonB [Shewanella sp. A14]